MLIKSIPTCLPFTLRLGAWHRFLLLFSPALAFASFVTHYSFSRVKTNDVSSYHTPLSADGRFLMQLDLLTSDGRLVTRRD